MRRRDLLVGAGGLAGGSSLIVGSGSFSTVDATRELQVDIVGDDEAYLELHHHHEEEGGKREAAVRCGDDVVLFDIRNRFSDTIETLDVSVADSSFETSVSSNHLDPGEEDEVRLADISGGCSEGSFDITVVIAAVGDGFSVEATRDFGIEVVVPRFECLEVTVNQTGNGNNAQSVGFDYVLNVASTAVFEIRENRPGKAGGNTKRKQTSESKRGSVTVEPDRGNFSSPIDITASLDPGTDRRYTKWESDDLNEILLSGETGCSE